MAATCVLLVTAVSAAAAAQESRQDRSRSQARTRRTIPVIIVVPGSKVPAKPAVDAGSSSLSAVARGKPTTASMPDGAAAATAGEMVLRMSNDPKPANADSDRPAMPAPMATGSEPPARAAAELQGSAAELRGVQVYLGQVRGSQQENGNPAASATLRVAANQASERDAPLTVAERTAGSDGDYRLGPGDVVDVFVWRNADLSRQVPVRPDGRISLPLVGETVAAGKTALELQREIAAVLGEFIQVPTVTVTITQIRSLVVYVQGNVRTPGPLQLDRNVTVMQAIAMAGGLNEFAHKNDVTILRTVDGVQERIVYRYGDAVKGKLQGPEIYLRAGDVVYVP